MRASIAVALLLIAACHKRSSDEAKVGAGESATTVVVPAVMPDAAADCDRPGGRVCVEDAVVECQADGSLGRAVQACDGGCKLGACVETCAVQDVELVYVLDDDNNLSSFDPRRLPDDPFHVIGKLACDPSDTPFSMAVDRKGMAWVLYHDGSVYRVSIIDATCSRAVYTAGTGAAHEFGMGFVSDGPGQTTEKLFVAANDSSRTLAQLDVSQKPPRWVPIAPVDAGQTRNPELTGTGDGSLFGYFPEDGAGFIRELDRATGKPVGQRLAVGQARGEVGAWAFAHWGGVFYVFTTIAGNSVVHAVHRKTGKHELVREHLPRPIVGAGVSTCAPLLERVP